MRPATLASLVSPCALKDIRLVVVILFSVYFPLVAASKLVQTDFPLSVPSPFGHLMSSESRDCKQAIGQIFCLSHSVQANQISSLQVESVGNTVSVPLPMASHTPLQYLINLSQSQSGVDKSLLCHSLLFSAAPTLKSPVFARLE